MKKKILITGSTDGIGLETAKTLAAQGHHVLLHGRNKAKLAITMWSRTMALSLENSGHHCGESRFSIARRNTGSNPP